MISVATVITPEFYDVDAMNVVWHGNHVRFLEVGRRAFLEHIGYSYAAMKSSGYEWPIIDLRLRYYRPLVLGQRVRIETILREWEVCLKLAYHLSDENDGTKLVRAHTVQTPVNIETKEMEWATPAVLREKLVAFRD